MGGEGSMQAMKTILQNNRSLLRKKRMFDEKSTIKNSNKIELEFNEVSKDSLEKVKEKIRVKAKKEKRKHKLILIVLTILITVAFYFLMKDFYIDFDLFFRQV